MGYDVQVVHSACEIGQEVWERLGGRRPFAGSEWFRFGEKVLQEDVPVYIVLWENGAPWAMGAFWLRRKEPLPISSRPMRTLTEVLLRRWPLLICQTPLASAPALMLPPPPERDRALSILAWEALNLARENGASFLLCPYLEQREVRWEGWPEPFSPVTMPDPGTYLPISWPDFDGYVHSLPGSVRKDFRRHGNRARDSGIEIRSSSRVSGINEAIVLIREVEEHHGSSPNPWTRAVLESAHRVAATWLTAHVDDRLVGCGLLLGDGDVRFLALLGLDYRVRYTYFQLVYAAIRSAIEEGAKVLRGGGGAYDLKRRLGFQLENNNNLVFAGRGPMLQSLGRWLVRTEAGVSSI